LKRVAMLPKAQIPSDVFIHASLTGQHAQARAIPPT
jgi:hypothetical protein